MKASEYQKGVSADGIETDELAELIDDGKMNGTIEKLDSHWQEVMKLCERYGFIDCAYGGTAIISTNENRLTADGAKILAQRLRMCSVELDVTE